VGVSVSDEGNTENLQQFVFSQRSFDRLESRLDTYPIALAVMASGAFPGVFRSVTLRDYSSETLQDYYSKRLQRPETRDADGQTEANNPRYWHLIDGGVVDNLGVETLRAVARSTYRRIGQEAWKGCVFLVVDAGNDYPVRDSQLDYVPVRDEREKKTETRTIGDLIDRNALDAVDSLMRIRRVETLQSLGLRSSQALYHPTKLGAFQLFPASRGGPSCIVWHLTFEGIVGVRDEDEMTGRGSLEERHERDRRRFRERIELATRARSIKTDYRLTDGVSSTERLQETLYEAARQLMNDDFPLKCLCRYLRKRDVELQVRCPVSP